MTHEERREHRREIAEFVRDNGANTAALSSACRRFGASLAKVRTACFEFDVPIAGEDRSVLLALKIVAELLCNADSFKVIARRHRVSQQRVSQVYRTAVEAGVPVPERARGRPAK